MKLSREIPNRIRESSTNSALKLARSFHDLYESLAPSFGYQTKKETRQFDPNTPNGKLMVAVCSEILRKYPSLQLEAAKDEDPPPAEDAPADEEGQDQSATPDPKDLTINFNGTRVRQYNKVLFKSNTGLVKRVTKDGLVVTVQPDQVDVFVNFADIVEQKISRGAIKEASSEGVVKTGLLEDITDLGKKFFRDKP